MTTQLEPEASDARIPARSERQAMDWSLVLASQGIEHSIDQDCEAGWGLRVASRDCGRACRILRQYRLENRRWPWRQTFPQDVVFDWGSAAWVLVLVLFYWVGERGVDLRGAGAVDGRAIAHGAWWRLFTAMFLHADLNHLLANAGFGLVLLGLTMGAYGTGLGLLAAFLAGAGGNALACLADPDHRSLGASGMVMACLGLLATHSLSIRHQHRPATKHWLGGLLAAVMLFLLVGSGPSTDLLAHLGGFVSGLLLGSILAIFPRTARSETLNAFAGTLFCVLVFVFWRLALKLSR